MRFKHKVQHTAGTLRGLSTHPPFFLSLYSPSAWMGEGWEALPEVMMKLQVGSGRGSLIHRADDVRTAGSTMREAKLGVSWRAGALGPKDSCLSPRF